MFCTRNETPPACPVWTVRYLLPAHCQNIRCQGRIILVLFKVQDSAVDRLHNLLFNGTVSPGETQNWLMAWCKTKPDHKADSKIWKCFTQERSRLCCLRDYCTPWSVTCFSLRWTTVSLTLLRVSCARKYLICLLFGVLVWPLLPMVSYIWYEDEFHLEL